MEVEKTFRPGANGTKRFVERFGDRLVCVRYRLDPDTGSRCTTVELIVERRIHRARLAPRPTPAEAPLLAVRIAYREHALRQQARAAGGRWDPDRRVWLLSAHAVDKLQLRDRLARPGS